MYDDRECAECGKVFTIPDLEKWTFKKKLSGKGWAETDYYCSWGCMRKTEKRWELEKMERQMKAEEKRRGRPKRTRENGIVEEMDRLPEEKKPTAKAAAKVTAKQTEKSQAEKHTAEDREQGLRITEAVGIAGTWRKEGDKLLLEFFDGEGLSKSYMMPEIWAAAAAELPAVFRAFGMEA